MIEFEELYDISVELGGQAAYWPGDPPYSRRLIRSLAGGGVSDVSLLTMTAHAGTHVDSPAHFVAGAKRLDDFTAEEFILPARVIESAARAAVGPEEVEAAGAQAGEAVLFKTRNSTSGRITGGVFFEDGVHLSPAAAELCVRRKVALVGIDYLTVDRYGDETFPAHRILLEASIRILETINLRGVPPGEYALLCLPLRMRQAEASPVRAILLR